MATQLPQPHHHGKHVGVVPEKGAKSHVPLDQLSSLAHVGVVDDPLLGGEGEPYTLDALVWQGHEWFSVDLIRLSTP